jgi:cohesin complex subunit SA-1/2
MPAYPIVSKSPAFRKFRKSFAEFFVRLVSNSAELGTIYSSDLIPILQAWIIPLSSSQIRSFRHTATMAALYLETGLCQVAASIDKELQTISRQREGERNKKSARNKAREAELEAKSKEFNARKTRLREYLKDNFNA